MSYYNTYGIRRMDNFAEAKKHFERVVPIRGNKDEIKPLGNRRYWNMASIAMPDADTVDLNYGWTVQNREPLVRWKSDNTFTVRHPLYANAYAPDNMTPYLSSGCRFAWDQGRVFVVLPGDKRYLMTRGEEMRFQMIEGKVFMLNKPVAYSYRVKRMPMATVMKEYEPFLSWLQVVLAVSHPMTNEELEFPYANFVEEAGVKSEKYYDGLRTLVTRDTDEVKRMLVFAEANHRSRLPFAGRGVYGANSKFHRESCELLQQWVTDTTAVNWVKAMHVIAQQAAESRYMYAGSGKFPGYQRCLALKHAQEYLRHLGIFLNRDEVLEKVRLDDGEAPSKRNTNYFTEIRFVL
jgi:hypothetical protein